MIVVSNTSPIINLAKINQLDLIRQIYHEINIPDAVYLEIANYQLPGSYEVKNSDWIIRQSISNTKLLESLDNQLDKGESEAIVLSVEVKADILLIDEFLGRNIAVNSGLNVTGLLGILLQAKSLKLLANVKPVLDQLVYGTTFRIKKDLYNHILKLAGE